MKLTTNHAKEVELYINEHGHYYFRIYDQSNGSVAWYNSDVLSEEEEQDLEIERNAK